MKNRTALITGGGGLLGPQHGIALASEGINIVLVDKKEIKLKRAKNRILNECPYSTVHTFSCDISKEKNLIKLKKKLKEKKIFIDILINNAAMNPKMNKYSKKSTGTVENYSTKLLIKEINVGIFGAFFCSKIFGTEMAKKNGGIIINIGSDLSMNAPDQSVYHKDDNVNKVKNFKPIGYSITKFGLLGITKYLATYWARKNVRCNMLIPGAVQTNQPKFLIKNVSKRIPMNRWAKPNEYRKAIQFLASETNSYMTGQTVIVDGGRTTW